LGFIEAEVIGVKRLNIIGIGVGDPEYVTVQAIKALQQTDVFFVVDKGEDKSDLLNLRSEICERYAEPGRYRTVVIPDPQRDDVASSSYGESVHEWHEKRVALWGGVVDSELAEDQVGGFLVWGDPAFYDSTLRILDGVTARATTEFEIDVIPGVSAMQALAARHKISLNQIGGSLIVTTGRQLAAGWPEGAADVIVMLDSSCSFRQLNDEDISIFWGAYLGTDDEILISGLIKECGEAIADMRSQARERKGWMFDTYLLRRLG
jgi:precorrin-6A synthase